MLTMESPTFFSLQTPSDRCFYLQSLSELPAKIPQDGFLAADIYDPCAEDILQILAEHLGNRLLVPEVWREILPQTGLLVSSAISGGRLSQRLEAAAQAAPGRCWLLTDCAPVRIALPSPNGQGQVLTGSEPAQLGKRPSFYSPELCCRYCYDLPDGVILFDTEETLLQKRQLAEEVGFRGAIYNKRPRSQ